LAGTVSWRLDIKRDRRLATKLLAAPSRPSASRNSSPTISSAASPAGTALGWRRPSPTRTGIRSRARHRGCFGSRAISSKRCAPRSPPRRRGADRSGRLHRLVRGLQETAPARAIRSFPWLAEEASLDEMRWFLARKRRARPGSTISSLMTQVKLPARAKLELARNYWDEMGRGNPKGMHGPMLDLWSSARLEPEIDDHRLGEPRPRQCDDRDGDHAPLRLAFGRRSGRDRADRARPLGRDRRRPSPARLQRQASGAISISTPCSTSSIARPGTARRSAAGRGGSAPRRRDGRGRADPPRCGARCFERYRAELW
jgi:hypothetical protein